MLASHPDVDVVNLPRGFQRSSLVGMIEEEVRSLIATAGDWLIPSDLDELNQYPADLRDLVHQMEQDGSTHLVGELRDRLAPEGVLAGLLPFDQGVSIWDQYPLEGDVTARIAGRVGSTGALSRGDLAWCMGHHRMRDSPMLRPFGSTGVAHHFKWRDGLAQTLAWRVDSEERARVPWSRESISSRATFESTVGLCPKTLTRLVAGAQKVNPVLNTALVTKHKHSALVAVLAGPPAVGASTVGVQLFVFLIRYDQALETHTPFNAGVSISASSSGILG